MFRSSKDVTRPPVAERPGTQLDRVYLCDICSDGWSSETEVEFHRSHTHSKIINDMYKNDEKSICKMCISEFTNKSALLRHIKSDHLLSSERAIRVERDIFICDYCGDIFFNKLLLVHHILCSHTSKSRNCNFKCPHCFKKTKLNTYWYHFLHHKMQSVAVCRICLKKCRDRLTLAEHVKTHPSVYRCDMCTYDTKKKDLFDIHIHRLHKRPGLNVSDDNNCWRKYYMPRKYSKTWQRINMMGWKGVKLTNDVCICVLCREICAGTESMTRHILIDHMTQPTIKNDYICTCGLVFTSKVLYKHHLFKIKHEHEHGL